MVGIQCAVYHIRVRIYAPSTHVGSLLARVRNELNSGAASYADVARSQFGPRFATFTRLAILSTFMALLPYYIIALTYALQTAFRHVMW